MNSENQPLRPKDIFLFLIGNSESIRRIAHSPWSLVVGILLVWTAGIARHYDLHPLLIQHRWIWAPFLVVIVSSFLIFFCAYFAFIRTNESKGPNFSQQYNSFFGLFLLTAPIAWIYAIPIEHFPGANTLNSAKWNMTFLGIVSLWRIGLIAKVLVVMTKAPWWKAVVVVLFPASLEAMIASFFEALDIVGLMGGFELSPSEQFKSDILNVVTVGSFWIAIATFFAMLIPLQKDRERGEGFRFAKDQAKPKGALITAGICLLVWILYSLPFQIKPDLREPRRSMDRLVQREKSWEEAQTKRDLEAEEQNPDVQPDREQE